MVYRIAQDVQQRLGQLLQHFAVKQHFFTDDGQLGLFAGAAAGLANGALKPGAQAANSLHPGVEHQPLKIAGDGFLSRSLGGQVAQLPFHRCRHVVKVGA